MKQDTNSQTITITKEELLVLKRILTQAFHHWARDSQYITGPWMSGEEIIDKEGEYWNSRKKPAWNQFIDTFLNEIKKVGFKMDKV